MKNPTLSLMKANRLVAASAGILLFSAEAWSADFPGYAKVENFDAITGGNVANLTAAAKYTNNQPDSVTFVDSLYYSRAPGADNYGTRISGFLTPAETAEYVFFVASDDSCSLYLSTDADPAHLKLVAADQGWQDSRTWVGPGGATSGAGTTSAVFRRGFNPGPTVMEMNNFEWVGPFQNRSDQFLNSPLANLVGAVTNRWPTTNASGNAVINLTANQSYYFQLLFKEGTGGENAGVAWKKASDPDPANSDPEIPGTFLKVTASSALSFLIQPQSQTIQQARPVTFTVNAVGVPGDSDQSLFTYQWRVNGTPITDGTGTGQSYTINSVALADDGKRYSVVVTTAGGLSGTSVEALLTVTADNTPPTIARIRTTDTFNIARVTFTEAVNNSAVTPSNYTISGGLTVSDANFSIVVNDPNNPEDPKNPTNPANRVTVILNTSTQADGGVYDLTVNAANVKDLVGNAISPNTGKMYANTFKSGLVLHKRWLGQGRNFETLLADTANYNSPTTTSVRTLVEEDDNDLASQVYMTTLSGFFIPATDGDYVFFTAVDNYGWLYLSTDESPANQVMIAEEYGWNGSRVWTGPGATTTAGNAGTQTPSVYRRGVSNPADPYGPWIGPFENRSDEFLASALNVNSGWGANRPFTTVTTWPTLNPDGSAKITLTAGRRYSFTLYHSEPENGQSCATFKLAGQADPANATASRMTGNLIGALIDPSSLPPLITNQPVSVDFTLGGTFSFSVGVDSAAAPTFQWYRGITPVVGETNRTLTIADATLAAVGSYYVAVSNSNGGVLSANVLAYTPAPPPQPRTFQQDSAGLLVIEAENFTGSSRAPDGHVWVAQADRTGFSGTGYVQPLADAGVNLGNGLGFTNNGPRLDFSVNFTRAGTNYLWVRGGEPRAAGDGDSVHAGIDGTPPTSAIQISGAPTFTTTGWNWVGNINGDIRAFLVVNNTGQHTVNFWMREDGFYFDKLLLTPDSTFTPTGVGPAESAVVGTGPVISLGRNANGEPVITYTGTLESVTSLGGTWGTVTGAISPYTVPTTDSMRFFRSKQ